MTPPAAAPPRSRTDFGQNLRVGMDALFANPLRTVLSTLGVIIGVASLVAVLSVGDGMERTVREQIERTTDLQYLNLVPVTTEEVDGQTFPLDRFPVFTATDAREAARLPGLDGVVAQLNGRSEATEASGRVRRLVTVLGTTESQQAVAPLDLAAGRFLTAAEIADTASPVAVISGGLAARYASAFSLPNPSGVLDREVLLRGAPFRVVGVTADSGAQETVWVGLAAAERALPPVARARPVLLLARMTRVDDADSVRASLARWADARFGSGATSVRSNEGRLAQVTQGILLFKLFMGAITGVSLLVGGIGIMNVLLASVTERTREIGIRKAMGATRRDVLWQFLAESVAVASLGSGLGVVLGLTGAYSITALMRSRIPGMQVFASVSASTLLVAVFSAAFVGLVFGTWPARRAARLDPIDAIRHE